MKAMRGTKADPLRMLYPSAPKENPGIMLGTGTPGGQAPLDPMMTRALAAALRNRGSKLPFSFSLSPEDE